MGDALTHDDGHPAEARLRAAAELLQRAGGRLETVLSGHSMGAAIPDGSAVRILSVDPGELKVGDVVAIQAGSVLVLHRVLARGARGAANSYLITQGDARWLADPPVHVSTVVGVVSEVQRGAGWAAPPPRSAPVLRRWLSGIPAGMLGAALALSVPLALAMGRTGNALWLWHWRWRQRLQGVRRRGDRSPNSEH